MTILADYGFAMHQVTVPGGKNQHAVVKSLAIGYQRLQLFERIFVQDHFFHGLAKCGEHRVDAGVIPLGRHLNRRRKQHDHALFNLIPGDFHGGIGVDGRLLDQLTDAFAIGGQAQHHLFIG
jgi:hypothetical protein